MAPSSRESVAPLSEAYVSTSHSDSSILSSISFIVISWTIMVLTANPVGNFPLNDDWAYAISVQKLLNGEIWLHDWGASNLVSQLFFGALFCKLFGFSYTTLRLSTLVLGLLGGLIFFEIVRRLKCSSKVACLAAVTVMACPVYFASSNTFMTDIPFFVFCIASIFAMSNALENGLWKSIAAGTLLSVIGILSRQIEMAVPIAFSLAFIAGRRFSFANIAKASFPTIVGAMVYFGFKTWLISTGKAPYNYGLQIEMIAEALNHPIKDIFATVRGNIFKCLSFVTFFSFPIAIYAFIKCIGLTKKNVIIVTLLSIVIWLHVFPHNFPAGGNILAINGIGPSNFDVELPKYVQKIWRYCAMSASISAGIIVYISVRFAMSVKLRWSNLEQVRLPLFLAFTVAIYMAPVLVLGTVYDRYLLIPLAIMILLVLIFSKAHEPAGKNNSNIGTLPIIIACSILIVSTLMVRDYLLCNRVRWQELTELIDRGIPASKIDGKFEFNGVYLYRNGGQNNKKGPWFNDDEYTFILTGKNAEAPPGFKIVSSRPVGTILPISPTFFHILHKM